MTGISLIKRITGSTNNLVYLETSDSTATATAAGYISAQTSNITSLNGGVWLWELNDCIMLSASDGLSWCSINSTFTTITAFTGVGSGDVTFTSPSIANHIAVFTNAAGNISQDIATAINQGNIQAGLSGHAGTLISFPATGSKGSFIFAAVANSGNTNTTLSNNAMGQASVINIPDPGNAIGQLLIGATATPFVSGNFPQNSGTAGKMIDSGVSVASLSATATQLGTIQQVSVTLTPAQVVTAYDTPLTLIATPGATKMIQIISAAVYTASTGNTAYATGTAPIIQYGTTAHGAGTSAVGSGLVAGDITAAASQVRTLGPAASTAWTGTSNLPITFSNATGDYTGGTGTNIVITLVYQVLTATV